MQRIELKIAPQPTMTPSPRLSPLIGVEWIRWIVLVLTSATPSVFSLVYPIMGLTLPVVETHEE